MPSIRILTWNSTGENPAKAISLGIQAVNPGGYVGHPYIDIYLIQEAQQAPGGAISNHLVGLAGGGYTVHHIQENLGGGGKGYICATRDASVVVVTPLALWNYAADPLFMGWAGHTSLQASSWAPPARTPAYTLLTVGATNILLITWHAPLGVSTLPIIVGPMSGGALIDAYLAFDQSQLLSNPMVAVGVIPDFIVIAGDLNAKPAALSKNYFGYIPLDDFNGVSNNLDHIMATSPAHTAFNFSEDYSYGTTSVHDIFCARMHW
ncbi:hypothetical protein PHLH7_42990 [Pseudomonas sp. Ost2]|uniref:hypothetical protein n=1 Tax=Pseudomonas sp. Ost2 TaxID=2678260 RepID=UPI001BEFD0D3|nr:hypothetical protein [Pseudomonas sp. Ost2]BBP78195.1 hypothetical protein PHLH7_42990 [Pseudomonas sp. Ost2]